MPVQTRSHRQPAAAPSLTTRIKKAVTGSTTTTPRATPKKAPTTATPRKKAAGVTKSSAHIGPVKTPRTHKRKPGLVDKIEGVALKIEGAITGRPGVKAAGTKKLRGTDGKGSHAPKVHH